MFCKSGRLIKFKTLNKNRQRKGDENSMIRFLRNKGNGK